MSNRILWRTATGRHDWADMHFVRRLLDTAVEKQLIGQTTWVRVGELGEQEEIRIDKPKLLSPYLLEYVRSVDHIRLEASGEQPHPWSVIISVFPFDKEAQEVDGSWNFVWLFFDSASVATPMRSCELSQAFMGVHNPDNTEYAFIHPYYHWVDFADEHYRIPVTIGPMFKGIFWANFLGPGHLNEFDQEKLSSIFAYQTEWIDNRGYFLITSDNILVVEESYGEAELLRLTELFHRALHPHSKWHR